MCGRPVIRFPRAVLAGIEEAAVLVGTEVKQPSAVAFRPPLSRLAQSIVDTGGIFRQSIRRFAELDQLQPRRRRRRNLRDLRPCWFREGAAEVAGGALFQKNGFGDQSCHAGSATPVAPAAVNSAHRNWVGGAGGQKNERRMTALKAATAAMDNADLLSQVKPPR